MLKTTASIITCAAVLGFINPAQGQFTSIATSVSTVDMCDGDKKKDKDVEKPSESNEILTLCDGDKKKDKDVEKPSESTELLTMCDGDKKGKDKGDGKPAE